MSSAEYSISTCCWPFAYNCLGDNNCISGVESWPSDNECSSCQATNFIYVSIWSDSKHISNQKDDLIWIELSSMKVYIWHYIHVKQKHLKIPFGAHHSFVSTSLTSSSVKNSWLSWQTKTGLGDMNSSCLPLWKIILWHVTHSIKHNINACFLPSEFVMVMTAKWDDKMTHACIGFWICDVQESASLFYADIYTICHLLLWPQVFQILFISLVYNAQMNIIKDWNDANTDCGCPTKINKEG